MNHVNVVLQSLYPLSPLRAAVFRASPDYRESPSPFFFSTEAFEVSSSNDPLELIFAKIYYDLENDKGATESSIYFADNYLINEASPSTDGTPISISSSSGDVDTPTKSTTDTSTPRITPDEIKAPVSLSSKPVEFFHWLTKELFKDPKYCKLMQWELTTISKGDAGENSFQDYFDIFSIPLTEILSIFSPKPKSISKPLSLQSYLDNFFSHKLETFSATIEGIRQSKSRETFKEFANSPEILSFLISESSSEIYVNPFIELLNGLSYKLTSVIYKEGDEYSVALRQFYFENDETVYKEEGSWIRLHDDEPIREISFDEFSNSIHMAFYMNSECDDLYSSNHLKPSQKIILDCLTKNYKHVISNTIKRQKNNRSNASSSPSPSKQSGAVPSKTKQMSNSMFNLSGQVATFVGDKNINPNQSFSHLTLPALPIKNSPADQAEIEAQLKTILVPNDLSHIKMNLITVGSFNDEEQNEQDDNVTPKISVTINEDSDSDKDYMIQRPIEDDFDFLNKKMNLREGDEPEEFDYFNEVQRKTSSTWETFYLNSSPIPNYHQEEHSDKTSPKPSGLFSGLRDLEIEFGMGKKKSKDQNSYARIDSDPFHKFIDAKLTKSRQNPNYEGIAFDSNLSSKKSSIRSILSEGLFYKPKTSIISKNDVSDGDKKPSGDA